MFAQTEQDQAKGRWVLYVCRNYYCKERKSDKSYFSEKVFEEYADMKNR